MKLSLSHTEENYIKAIYSLFVEFKKPVSTNKIADKLLTKASSVTDMIKKLADKSLVNYVKYQGVSLTKDGLSVAVLLIRNHRLWEVFLVKTLGFKWDEVHEVAEQLEHVKSNHETIVLGVKDNSSAFLKYLDHTEIKLGSCIKVIHKEDFDNSMLIEIEGKQVSISQQISSNLYVKQNV